MTVSADNGVFLNLFLAVGANLSKHFLLLSR